MSTPSPDQLVYRILAVETQLKNVQDQMHQYELARENDLKFQNLRAEVERLARDQAEIKAKQADITGKLAEQEVASQRRDTEQRESQSALQIKVLIGIVSTVITILVGILIAFITHLFG